jgi:hypothetical protein
MEMNMHKNEYEIILYRDHAENLLKEEAAINLRIRALQSINPRIRDFLIHTAERLEHEVKESNEHYSINHPFVTSAREARGG